VRTGKVAAVSDIQLQVPERGNWCFLEGWRTHSGILHEGNNPFLQAIIKEPLVCGISRPCRKALKEGERLFTQFVELIILHIINTGDLKRFEETMGSER
jgi:hypothetical protein